jgi:hypothetical protein
LVGVKNACDKRRQRWKISDDSDGKFADEMITIVDFTKVKKYLYSQNNQI